MLRLTDRVTFHGEVRHDHLPDYYRAADLFVLSSRHESQSLVALEAAACGCPVVGTAVGVLPELLDTAQVAPVGDARALAAAMTAMIANPPDRARAAGETRERVLARFSLGRTAGELEALYLGLPAGAR
jgi:glycosyltransferase involved in cell wall biosynthesis